MHIYEVINESGEVFAFEINNTLLSRKKVIQIIEELPGVTVVSKPQDFVFDNESEFCQFEYEGDTFIIEEPWDDSSRYWIGPKPIKFTPNINSIMNHFRDR